MVSYRRIFQGKNVDFIIEIEITHWPEISEQILNNMKARLGNDDFPFHSELYLHIADKNLNGVVETSRKIIEPIFHNFFDKYPQFITSENFSVHIKYYMDEKSEINAGYNSVASSESEAFFKINLLMGQLNPVQFLKKYEEACKYFRVKNPVFNSRSYYYYKSKCKENYRARFKARG